MRKTYTKPVVRAESLEVGVFGSYGSDDCRFFDGQWAPIIGIIHPLFGLCCGG